MSHLPTRTAKPHWQYGSGYQILEVVINTVLFLLVIAQAGSDSLYLDLAKHITSAVVEHANSKPGNLVADSLFIDLQLYARHLGALAKNDLSEQDVEANIRRPHTHVPSPYLMVDCLGASACPETTTTNCRMRGDGIQIGLDSAAVSNGGGAVVFVKRHVTEELPDGSTRVILAHLRLEFVHNPRTNWALATIETLKEDVVGACWH